MLTAPQVLTVPEILIGFTMLVTKQPTRAMTPFHSFNLSIILRLYQAKMLILIWSLLVLYNLIPKIVSIFYNYNTL
ncbi:unnamed protein product [Blepharisma stoltei]|uniref:Uncharacterized protein n=1 Tax=Blepharisma stoltei TaxID=1481888 RepID=A0AAU9J7U1_9CILI|nr:unnamed protein product [Blepharisma stoltei]